MFLYNNAADDYDDYDDDDDDGGGGVLVVMVVVVMMTIKNFCRTSIIADQVLTWHKKLNSQELKEYIFR